MTKKKKWLNVFLSIKKPYRLAPVWFSSMPDIQGAQRFLRKAAMTRAIKPRNAGSGIATVCSRLR